MPPILYTFSGILQDGRLMPVVVMLVAVVLLMTSMRRRRAPADSPRAAAQPRDAADRRLLRGDMDELLVELEELSRRITAEIDTRFAKLEAAMRDADRRIAVLNRLTRQSESPPGNGASSTRAAAEGEDPRHTVIHELADAGFTPIEIGRELGRTPGEVELILNLRRHSSKE